MLTNVAHYISSQSTVTKFFVGYRGFIYKIFTQTMFPISYFTSSAQVAGKMAAVGTKSPISHLCNFR